MKFGDVIDALRAGKHARRPGWEPWAYIKARGQTLMVAKKTGAFETLALWSEDIFADDWEIRIEPMNIAQAAVEAATMAVDGGSFGIRRRTWGRDCWIDYVHEERVARRVRITWDDIEAVDWEVVRAG